MKGRSWWVTSITEGEKEDLLNTKRVQEGGKPPPKITLATPFLRKNKNKVDDEAPAENELSEHEARKIKKRQILEKKQREEKDAQMRDEWFSFLQNKSRADILKFGLDNLNVFSQWRQQSEGSKQIARLRPQTAPVTSIQWRHVEKESDDSALDSHKLHSNLIRQYIAALAPSSSEAKKDPLKTGRHLAPYFLVAEDEVTSRRCIPLQLSQEKKTISIGRAEKCDVVFDKSWTSAEDLQPVSRHHCEIAIDKDVLYLKDCSSNGTFVNGKRCHADTVILKLGDKLKFGSFSSKLEYAIVAPNVTAPISEFPPTSSTSATRPSALPGDELKRNRILSGEENVARLCADSAFALWKDMKNIQPMDAARMFARFGDSGTESQLLHAAAGFHHLSQTPLGINNIIAARAVPSLFALVDRCANTFYKELALDVIHKLCTVSAEARAQVRKEDAMQRLMRGKAMEDSAMIKQKLDSIIKEFEVLDAHKVEPLDSRPSTAYSACSTVKASSRPSTAKLFNGRSWSRPSSALEASTPLLPRKVSRHLRPNTASGRNSYVSEPLEQADTLDGCDDESSTGVQEAEPGSSENRGVFNNGLVGRDWVRSSEQARGSKWKAIRSGLLGSHPLPRPHSAMAQASRPLSALLVRTRPHSATEEHDSAVVDEVREPGDLPYDGDVSKLKWPSRAGQPASELEPIDESGCYMHEESSPSDSRLDPDSPVRPAGERHGGERTGEEVKAVMEKIRYKQKLMKSLKLMYTAEMAGLESEIIDLLQDVRPGEGEGEERL